MAGFDPAIHVFLSEAKPGRGCRVKPGHEIRERAKARAKDKGQQLMATALKIISKNHLVIPGRCGASNPESRDSGSGPSDHPGMTTP
jgi:hypothetical protein